MNRTRKLLLAGLALGVFAPAANAQWSVSVYNAPPPLTGIIALNDMATADSVFASPPAGYTVETSTVTSADLFQNGGNGQFTLNNPFGPSWPVNADDNDFTSRATGTLNILTGGSYDFFTDSDDGNRLRLDLNRNGTFEDATESVVPDGGLQGTGTPERSGTIALTPGPMLFEMTVFERGGGASIDGGYRNAGDAPQFVFGDAAGGIGLTGPITVRTVGPKSPPLANINNINEGEEIIALGGPDATDSPAVINYADNGFPAGTPEDEFALDAVGVVDVIGGTTGTFTLYVDSDDGFRLRRNGVVIGEFVDPTGASNTTMANVTLNDGDLLRLTFFEAGGGERVTFRLNDANGALIGTAASGINILPVPEPASLSVLGLGALALLARRRREV